MKYDILSIFLIFMVTFPPHDAEGLTITEVMPTGQEWIEIWTEEAIDIYGSIVRDASSEDEISCCDPGCDMNISPGTYFVITTEGMPGHNVFCVDDKKIGNGIGNDGDTISFNVGNSSSEVSFSTSRENLSFSFDTGSPKYSRPTPGHANDMLPDILAELLLPDTMYIDQAYGSFRLTDLYAGLGKEFNVSISVFNGSEVVTYVFEGTVDKRFAGGEISISTAGNFTACLEHDMTSICKQIEVIDISQVPCDMSISISVDKDILKLGDGLKYSLDLNGTFPAEIEYWIEDLAGTTVKPPYDTKLAGKKTYTPEDAGAYIIKAKLHASCDDSEEGNIAEKLFAVKQERIDDNIEILDLFLGGKKEIVCGSMFEVKIHASRADHQSGEIKVWVEKDGVRQSYVSYGNLYRKNQESDLRIPILIRDNCRQGEAMLVASAFGSVDKDTIALTAPGSSSLRLTSEQEEGYVKVLVECEHEGTLAYSLYKGTRKVMENETSHDGTSTIAFDLDEGTYTFKAEIGSARGEYKFSVSEQKPLIKSFYTLSKKKSGTINLFSRIQGEGQVELESRKETVVMPAAGEMSFPVELERGRNIFVLKLMEKNKTVDTKAIVIMGEQEDEPLIELQATSVSNENSSLVSQGRRNVDLMTGNVAEEVYISSSERSRSYAVIFACLAVVGAVIASFLLRPPKAL